MNDPLLRAEIALCSHYKVLPTSEEYQKLNWAQKLALFQGLADSRKYTQDLIHTVIETLKPWLDKDLYFSMKEQEENTRVNTKWGVEE